MAVFTNVKYNAVIPGYDLPPVNTHLPLKNEPFSTIPPLRRSTLPHNRLITQAAKEVLAPAWLAPAGPVANVVDDRGWWLGVVEFQPSSWSRGTYMNFGAIWLGNGFLAMRATSSFFRRCDGWPAWDAAMALGLAGQTEAASAMLARVLAADDDSDWWLAAQRQVADLQRLITSDPERFRSGAESWIARYRETLRLPPLA